MGSSFITYDPTQSVRTQLLERSKALSHAAKAFHSHRRRRGTEKHLTVQAKAEPKDNKCRCQHDCECDQAQCPRFRLIPYNGSGDPFSGLPIVMTPALHETIVFWTKPALWDCKSPLARSDRLNFTGDGAESCQKYDAPLLSGFG